MADSATTMHGAMPRAPIAAHARPAAAALCGARPRVPFACAAILLLAIAWGTQAHARTAADRAPELAERVASLVNDYRAQHRLGTLHAAQALARLADEHSRQMAEAERLSHDGFRGRFERAGSALCVENVASGFASAEALVEGWRRSPEHDRNLLEPRIARMGVAARGRHVTFFACR